MSEGWENYKAAPIEEFHGEAIKEFHKGAEFDVNETFVDGMRFVNGIEFNRLLAIFKVKIMKEYGITNKAIKITDRTIKRLESNVKELETVGTKFINKWEEESKG